MKSVIVGTAGHIDHGKTALVKALTGIDTDRLEEEKRRGITIDVGFAHLALLAPGGKSLRFGFIDVPGHERFVRNMLAGIGGIDLVLLVIAADECIKPQTREHFDICRLLSIRRGITVLTKSDLVDPETLDVVRLEVGEFLRGSFLDPDFSPVIPVSALTGVGLDDLKHALAAMASEITAKDSTAFARLPLDRVFTMKGFGTVVTGTLVSGTIRKEDELEVFPPRKPVRVRGVQTHGRATEQAVAGQRTALNLPGVATEELERGMVLATPATFHATSKIDVSLSLLPAVKAVKNRARVHFHAYTLGTMAEVALLEGKQLDPGSQGFARLRLDRPTLLLPGDRFIIRQFSPLVTIGGGVVLDPCPLPREKNSLLLPFLNILNQGVPGSMLIARILRRGKGGLTLAQATAETGWLTATIKELLSRTLREGTVLQTDKLLLHVSVVDDLKQRLRASIDQFHRLNPLIAGINRGALREELALSSDVFSALLDILVREKTIVIAGEIVHLPGRGVVMKEEEAESKTLIEQTFAAAGLRVPALKYVLQELKVEKARALKIVTLLLREKVLVKISEDLVFHRQSLEELRQKLAAEKAKSPYMDVSRFKDLTGVSRKYAIPLLEYLDRERVTRRSGDLRVIL